VAEPRALGMWEACLHVGVEEAPPLGRGREARGGGRHCQAAVCFLRLCPFCYVSLLASHSHCAVDLRLALLAMWDLRVKAFERIAGQHMRACPDR
jgi:hypothetical protein